MIAYVLIAFAFCAAVLSADYRGSIKAHLKSWLKKKPYKKGVFYLLLLAAAIQAVEVCENRREADREKTDLNGRISDLKKKMKS